MAVFNVADTCKILGTSKTTIRNYSKLYSAHLSSGANPAIGLARKFTDEDLRVLAYAKEMSARGHAKSDILDNMVEGLNSFEWERPQDKTEPKPDDMQGQIVPVELIQVWDAQRREYIEQVEELNEENKNLLREVGRLEGENKVLRETRKGFFAGLFGGKD